MKGLVRAETCPFFFQAINCGIDEGFLSQSYYEKLEEEGAQISFQFAKLLNYRVSSRASLEQAACIFLGMMEFSLLQQSNKVIENAAEILRNSTLAEVFNFPWKKIIGISGGKKLNNEAKEIMESFALKPGRPWFGQIEYYKAIKEKEKSQNRKEVFVWFREQSPALYSGIVEFFQQSKDSPKEFLYEKMCHTILIGALFSNSFCFPLRNKLKFDIYESLKKGNCLSLADWRINKYLAKVPESVRTELGNHWEVLKTSILPKMIEASQNNQVVEIKQYFNYFQFSEKISDVCDFFFEIEKGHPLNYFLNILSVRNLNAEEKMGLVNSLSETRPKADDLITVLDKIDFDLLKGKIPWHRMSYNEVIKVYSANEFQGIVKELFEDIFASWEQSKIDWNSVPWRIALNMFRELSPESRRCLINKKIRIPTKVLVNHGDMTILLTNDNKWYDVWLETVDKMDLFARILFLSQRYLGIKRQAAILFLAMVAKRIVKERIRRENKTPKEKFFDIETKTMLSELFTKEEFKEFEKNFKNCC